MRSILERREGRREGGRGEGIYKQQKGQFQRRHFTRQRRPTVSIPDDAHRTTPVFSEGQAKDDAPSGAWMARPKGAADAPKAEAKAAELTEGR